MNLQRFVTVKGRNWRHGLLFPAKYHTTEPNCTPPSTHLTIALSPPPLSPPPLYCFTDNKCPSSGSNHCTLTFMSLLILSSASPYTHTDPFLFLIPFKVIVSCFHWLHLFFILHFRCIGKSFLFLLIRDSASLLYSVNSPILHLLSFMFSISCLLYFPLPVHCDFLPFSLSVFHSFFPLPMPFVFLYLPLTFHFLSLLFYISCPQCLFFSVL